MTQKDGWRPLAVCLVLALGTIGLYAPAYTFNFVNFDDQLLNPNLNKGVINAMGWVFNPSAANAWQPLVWLSHVLDCQIYGVKPAGHHITSLILHALNSVLVFLVLRQLTGTLWRSAAVAAFFAWHPLHVEAVAWVAQRTDLVCGFFLLLTLWAYGHYAANLKSQISSSKWYYIGAIIFCAFAVMSSAVAVTLPVILLVLDWWPLGRMTATPERPMKKQALFLVAEKIPFLLLAAASCVLNVIAAHSVKASPIAQLPFRIRFATAGMSCLHYLAKSFWPADLAAGYPFLLHWPKWELIGTALILLIVCVVAIQTRKTRPYWMTGWIWFLITLFPVLNLIQSGAQPMADRYMYIPSIGLWMLICWEAYDLAAFYPSGRVVLGGLCAVLLVSCGVLSELQLHIWKDQGTLLARIPEASSNAGGHADYAAFLLRTRQAAQAQVECEKALGIASNSPVYSVLMGDILMAQGKIDPAIQRFQFALHLDNRLDTARLELGRAFLAKNRVSDAAEEFKAVLRNEPKNFEAHHWFARTLMLQGNSAAAASELEASLKLQLNQPEALNDFAWLLATDPHTEIRHGAEAVKLAARACDLTRGQEPAFIGTLAAALAETGDFDNAVKMGQKAYDVAMAEGRKALAETNLQLTALYRAHKPFREKAVTP